VGKGTRRRYNEPAFSRTRWGESMSFGRRVRLFRVGLGLLLLVGFHLLSDIPLPGLVRQWYDQHARGAVDDVTAYEARFEKAKGELPAHGMVGYRAQVRKKGTEEVFTYQSGEGVAELPAMEAYWIAQYALAPVILDARGKHAVTVVNGRDEVTVVRIEGR
jgi:hypothetical protein